MATRRPQKVAGRGKLPRTQQPNRNPKTPKPESRIVKTSTSVVGSIFTALLGFVGGSLSPLGTKLATTVLDPDVIADRVRNDAPIVFSIDSIGHFGARGMYAFAEPLDLNAEEVQALKSHPNTSTGEDSDVFKTLVERRNGVRVAPLRINMTLRGARDETVHITGIHVNFIKKHKTHLTVASFVTQVQDLVLSTK